MKISKLLALVILSPPKMIFFYYWSKFKRKQMSNTAQKMKFSVFFHFLCSESFQVLTSFAWFFFNSLQNIFLRIVWLFFYVLDVPTEFYHSKIHSFVFSFSDTCYISARRSLLSVFCFFMLCFRVNRL